MTAHIPRTLTRPRFILAASLSFSLVFGGLPTSGFASLGQAGNGSAGSPAFAAAAADTTPPNTTISGAGVNAGWVDKAAVTFSLSAKDAGSGVKETRWRLNRTGAFTVGTRGTVTAEGTTTVEYYSIDKASNVEPSKIATIQIDRSDPMLTSDRLPNYTGSATIRAAATDSLSGVASMAYKLDGAHNVAVDATASISIGPVTGAGAHTLTVSATDKAGNKASATLTFTVNSVDSTTPTTKIAFTPAGYVQNTWSSSTVTFTLSATDSAKGSGIAGTHYRVDGSAVATYTGPVGVATEGTHTVDFWSIDLVGNRETTRTATVKVDKTAPVSSSNAQAVYDADAVILLASTDTLSGVDSVHWSLDAAKAVAGTRVTSSVPGTHTLQFWAVDNAGNREANRTVVFHVTLRPAFLLNSRVYFMNNRTNPALVTIASYLKQGAVPLSGRRVVLEYSSSNGFARFGRVFGSTTALGWFRFYRRITSRTYFRVRFEGDGVYSPALSPTFAYVPKVALSAPSAYWLQRSGRAFTVRGNIYPPHRAGTRVKIERYLVVGGVRVSRGYVWAYIRTGNSYAYSTRLILGRGTWQLRAVAPYDTSHATTASAYRTFVVR